VFILVLVSAGITYKFVYQGSVAERLDGRMAILLEKNERDLVLSEMRIFLESVQQIVDGISDKDMQRVAESARKSGVSAQAAIPGSLVGKLPLSFKQLGFDTHQKFEGLALDADDLGDPDHTLSQLGTILKNCVACHSTYRFEVVKHNTE
jgi:hypothetical protein